MASHDISDVMSCPSARLACHVVDMYTGVSQTENKEDEGV